MHDLKIMSQYKYLLDDCIGPNTVCMAFKITETQKKNPLWLRFPGSLSGCWSFSILRAENLSLTQIHHLAPSDFPRTYISQSLRAASLHIMMAHIFLKQFVPLDLSYPFELPTPEREVLHPALAMKSSNN